MARRGENRPALEVVALETESARECLHQLLHPSLGQADSVRDPVIPPALGAKLGNRLVTNGSDGRHLVPVGGFGSDGTPGAFGRVTELGEVAGGHSAWHLRLSSTSLYVYPH